MLASRPHRAPLRRRRRIAIKAETRLVPEPTSAGEARRFVTKMLADWGVVDTVDLVTLLVSELVTNSVLHAHSIMGLAVELREQTVRVELADRSPAMPVLLELGDGTLTGRGLALVDTCAVRWGVEPHRAGKTVWFEVAA